jgi:hypothetical protein
MPVTVQITGSDSLEDAREWLAGHDFPSGLLGGFAFELYEAVQATVDAAASLEGRLTALAGAVAEVNDAYYASGPESDRLADTIQKAMALTGDCDETNNESPIEIGRPIQGVMGECQCVAAKSTCPCGLLSEAECRPDVPCPGSRKACALLGIWEGRVAPGSRA